MEELGQCIDVSVLSAEEGLNLLFQRSKCERSAANIVEVEKIVDKLGYFALAIHQAGAYISAGNLELGYFLSEFHHRRELLRDLPGMWDYRKKLGGSESETALSAFTTWELSVEQISGNPEERQAKLHFLTLAAFFDGKEISQDLFYDSPVNTLAPDEHQIYTPLKACPAQHPNKADEHKRSHDPYTRVIINNARLRGHWNVHTRRLRNMIASVRGKRLILGRKPSLARLADQLTPDDPQGGYPNRLKHVAWKKDDLERVLVELRDLSLLQNVEMKESGTNFSLHPLIQDWMRCRIESNSRPGFASEAVEKLRKYIDLEHSSFFLVRGDQNIISHIEAVDQNFTQILNATNFLMDSRVCKSRLLFGLVLVLSGRHSEAEASFKQMIQVQERHLKEDHPDTLDILRVLAIVYRYQQRYPEAEKLYDRILAKQKITLCQDHSHTLRTLDDLAFVYLKQQRYLEAEELLKHHIEVLEPQERQSVEDYTTKLNVILQLGDIYRCQGRLSEEERLFQCTIEEFDHHLGRNDINKKLIIAAAAIYKRLGLYKEAEVLYRRKPEQLHENKWLDHFYSLCSLASLAVICDEQERYDEAESLCEQVVDGAVKQLGLNNPHTLETMSTLANIYNYSGDYKKAEELCRKALEGSGRQSWWTEPCTRHVAESLAIAYKNQGRHDEAEEIFNRLSSA